LGRFYSILRREEIKKMAMLFLEDRRAKTQNILVLHITIYSLAISLAVFCPLRASSATHAFTLALCRFRCIFIIAPLLGFDTAILAYFPVQILGDIITIIGFKYVIMFT